MNKLNIHLIFVFSLLFGYFSYGQYYQFEHIGRANYTGNIMSCDDRGNLIIGSRSHITKLDFTGDFIGQYYPMFNAETSCIDAKDPRRILVFYKDLSYVVFLNQNLASTGSISYYQITSDPKPISLDDLNISFSHLACLDEYNEAYWIYDENTSDIILLDKDNQIDFRGDALDQYTELDPNPNFMIMEDNRLFINNPTSGVYIFDENGSFVSKLPLMGLKKVQAKNNLLFYASNSFLVTLNLVTGEEKYHPLPIMRFKDWTLNAESVPARISFLTDDGVEIYSFDLKI